MPTIITRGLGYDTQTVIDRRIGQYIHADVVATTPILAVVEQEDTPVARVNAVIPIGGTVSMNTSITGVVTGTQIIRGVVEDT